MCFYFCLKKKIIDKFNIVSWTRDQYLNINSLDLDQIEKDERAVSSLAAKLKEEDDYATLNNAKLLNSQQAANANCNVSNLLPQTTNTTNSSRKSSISEYVYGTPPTHLTSYLSTKTLTNETREPSFNLDEPTIVIKSSSSAFSHEFLRRNLKCFGAKFSGPPGTHK